MTVRKYDEKLDANTISVALTYHEGDSEGSKRGWRPSAAGGALTDEIFSTVDEAMKALDDAGWLHLEVWGDFKLDEVSPQFVGLEYLQIHDPDSTYGDYLFRSPAFSVKKTEKSGIAIDFLAEDAGEIVSGTKWFTDGAAEQIEELLSSAKTDAEKVKIIERRLDMKDVMKHKRAGDASVSSLRISDDYGFAQSDLVGWGKKPDGSPAIYTVVYSGNIEHTPMPMRNFANLDLAREYAAKMVEKASLDMDGTSTPTP